MQQRGAYGPLILLLHKTRARHKRQAQVQNIQQTKRVSEGSRQGPGACELRGGSRVQGEGCPPHESTQPGPLTLLPQAQVQTVKTSLRGVERCRGSRRMFREFRGPGGPGRPGISEGSREGSGSEVASSCFFTKSQVKSFQNHLPSCPSCNFKLSQPQKQLSHGFERSSVKKKDEQGPGHRLRGDFAGIYLSLPQCIEDVHNMRARSREVHTDL